MMCDELERLKRCFMPRQWFAGEGEPDVFMPEGDALMWVYRKEGDKYVVGYYTPDKEWFADSWYKTPNEAAERVNYLMGGKR